MAPTSVPPTPGCLKLVGDAVRVRGLRQDAHQPAVGMRAAVHDRNGGALAKLGGRADVFLAGQIVGDGALQGDRNIRFDRVGSDACAAQADLLLDGERAHELAGVLPLQELGQDVAADAIVEGLALEQPAEPLVVALESDHIARLDAACAAAVDQQIGDRRDAAAGAGSVRARA